MYEKSIQIQGKHADYMNALTAKLARIKTKGIFERNIDVYISAPLIGFLYKRNAKVDSSSDTKANIFAEQINREMEQLQYNYRLIMLVNKENTTFDERQSRAFRYDNNEEKRKEGDDIFESYVRGGIEVLYEKIIKNGNTTEEYIFNLFEFLQEFNDRYYEDGSLTDHDIINICRNIENK